MIGREIGNTFNPEDNPFWNACEKLGITDHREKIVVEELVARYMRLNNAMAYAEITSPDTAPKLVVEIQIFERLLEQFNLRNVISELLQMQSQHMSQIKQEMRDS